MRKKILLFSVFAFVFAYAAQNVICSPSPSSVRLAGLPSSPIETVAFVSSNCPSCREAAVILYEMANTVYRGKIRVWIKPLYKQLGDIAVIAANEQDKSWELFRAYSNSSARITADNINAFFERAQINIDKIYEDMRDSVRIFSILQANYEDAQKCGMQFTPHILFNGISYEGAINPREMTEFIDGLLREKL